ncbi:response regulator [Thermodesulfobacteriota bacterium]
MNTSYIKDIFFKPRVLVVDDEKRIRDACYTMLSDEGFTVDRAETGKICLNKIAEKHYDIILLDLMMPELNGLEVLPCIRNSHPDTVIIVITGYATIEHSVEAMKRGAFDFIAKPFSPQDLRVVVAKAIEYIRTLQDIATEKSRMRVLLNHIGGGVLATDNQQNIALANPTFIKMIGYHGQNLIGRHISEIIENKTILEMIAKALSASRDEFVELTEELKEGTLGKDEQTVFSVRCVPFKDRLGRNLGTVTVLHDITAIKKIDQMKSDFVSMVAHELKSPMSTVLAQLEIILDEIAGPVTDKQKTILTRASERIKELVNLSSELLDLAKIESGLISQEREQLDVDAVINNQVEFYFEMAQAKHLTLTYLRGENLPKVMANKVNVEEVLSNLISNAIRYTPEGGEITLSTAIEKDYLAICVKDTGFGIPAEVQERIFDRFYRIKNEKTRYITGTGLGLAIVKNILESHNGNIQVESELDKGSTFTCRLPLMTM